MLDSIARMVLHAVCRSCHVRLHQATLDTLLDELPLAEGVTASSILQASDLTPMHADLTINFECARCKHQILACPLCRPTLPITCFG